MQRREVVIVNLVTSISLFACILFFLYNMERFVDVGLPSKVSPLEFPFFITAASLVVCALYIYYSLINYILARRAAAKAGETIVSHDDNRPLACAVYVAILYGYYFLILYVGFIVATPIVMLGVSWILGGRWYYLLGPAYIGFSMLLYFGALKLMKIALPLGLLFES